MLHACAVRISIHVLREEDDIPWSCTASMDTAFLSTSSARRTTRVRVPQEVLVDISIHVLREEDDQYEQI